MRTMPALVVSALATALGALAAAPASAQDFTEAQKKIQAEHTAQVKAGKVEPCFGTALKGQNDCYAGCGHDLRRYEHGGLSGQCVQAGAEGNVHLHLDAQVRGQPQAHGVMACWNVRASVRPIHSSTYAEADFITEVVRLTGCGLLLDVSNAHVAAGPVPTLIEWDANVPEWPVLEAQAARAETILHTSGMMAPGINT